MKAPGKGFIIGAAVGILVIPILIATHTNSTFVLLTLWPTSIFGFGYQGGSPWTLGLLIGSVELIGNALIYGAIGLLIGSLVSKLSEKTVRS
jgi:hypothetical protein